MHQNLEKRFIRLAVQESAHFVALEAFRVRYSLLFDALAEELGISREKLAQRVGFDPCPEGGNKIMKGEAEASNEDVAKLLRLYLENNDRRKA